MKLVRTINRGGFGEVDEVEEKGKRFARKTFKPDFVIASNPDLAASAERRFKREVATQAQLSHPNIVPIIRHNLSANPPWFLMPLADSTLAEEIKTLKGGNISLGPLLDALAGLEELHRLGYVHRDLKPHNILHLPDRKGDGHWALADLGLVLPTADDATTITGTSSLWLTQRYAAPEVLAGFHSASRLSDIFAFGCILHDYTPLASARIPFSKLTATGTLGHVIERCTEIDPQRRFPSVAALRSALVAAFAAPPLAPLDPKTSTLLQNLANPASMTHDGWAAIAREIDYFGIDDADSDALLTAIDIEQLDALFNVAPSLFSQVVAAISQWVCARSSFEWAFCDVLGARLLRIFELGDTRDRANAAVAALHLGCNHNRWFVMRAFMRMAGQTIDEDLADRLVVEIYTMGDKALRYVWKIEHIISVSRTSLHPKLRSAIDALEQSSSMKNSYGVDLG